MKKISLGKQWEWLLLPLLSVIIEFFVFPPLNFWPASFIALVPIFFFLIQEKSFFRRFFGVFLYRIALLLGVAYFAFEPIMFLFSALLLSFVVIPFSIIQRRFPTFAFILLPFLWAFFEHIESRYSFIAFYAVTIGNAIGSSPFVGLAAIGGLFLLTLFVTITNGLFAALVLYRHHRRIARALFFGIAVFLIAGFGLSHVILSRNVRAYQRLPNRMTVAIVSTNQEYTRSLQQFFNQELTPVREEEMFTTMQSLLVPIEWELERRKVDTVFLPDDFIENEGSVWLRADQEAKEKFGIENNAMVIRAYRELARKYRVYLLANTLTWREGRSYNTMLLFDRNGSLINTYDKVHLTFGSEYWPFNFRPLYSYTTFSGASYLQRVITDLLPNLGEQSAITSRISFGRGSPKGISIGDLSVITPICNETHYLHEIKKYVRMFSAEAVFSTSGNRWIKRGLHNYLSLFMNLRRIGAVYLNRPIVLNGRPESAGVITPDGTFEGEWYNGQQLLIHIAEIRY